MAIADNAEYSRRQFLEMSGWGLLITAAVGSGGIGLLLRYLSENTTAAQMPNTPPVEVKKARIVKVASAVRQTPEISEREKAMVMEIAKFRKSLGYTGLPPELVDVLESKTPLMEWPKPPDKFTNRLPPNLFVYGEKLDQIVKTVFPGKHLYLVQGTKLATDAANLCDYDARDRTVEVAPDITKYQNPGRDFTETIFHEGVGHGSDPELFKADTFPRSVFLALDHAKWRMLKEAFAVKGQFLNHPGDLNLPNIVTALGDALLQYVRENDKTWAGTTETSDRVISEMKKRIGPAYTNPRVKIPPETLKKFGMEIYQGFRQGKIVFGEYFQQEFEIIMDNGLQEIYAEMIRMAFLHPEQINNAEIIAGCQEVIEAIRGEKIDMAQIRAQVQVFDKMT